MSFARTGSRKSVEARVIYFNLTAEEVVLLFAVDARAKRGKMAPAEIRKMV